MPAPQHYRVTLSGILGPQTAPVETFSTGFALGPEDGTDSLVSLPPQSEWNTAQQTIRTWFASSGSLIGEAATLTEVRCAWVNAQGKVNIGDDGAYLQYKNTALDKGSRLMSAGGHPFQTTAVLSLQSPRADAGGRGRMFLPCPAVPIGIDGLMAASEQEVLLASTTKLISDVNAAFASLRVVVASSGSALQGRPPTLSPVTFVRVGRALDTMRSRRRALNEQYTRRAVTDAF